MLVPRRSILDAASSRIRLRAALPRRRRGSSQLHAREQRGTGATRGTRRPARMVSDMPSADDWRRQEQEEYLRGATLTLRRYQAQSAGWEHEHCEFCWAKFMDGDYSSAAAEAL